MDPVQFKPILFKDQLYINGYSLCHTGNCTTEILQERETCFQKTNLVALGGHGVPWADSKFLLIISYLEKPIKPQPIRPVIEQLHSLCRNCHSSQGFKARGLRTAFLPSKRRLILLLWQMVLCSTSEQSSK